MSESGHSARLPLAYRWFIARNLVDWTAWYFLDDKKSIMTNPNLERERGLQDQFRWETGVKFDVYLFARRQDMDDFAFFTVYDGVVEDNVITDHMTFVGKTGTIKPPTERAPSGTKFIDWVKRVPLKDIEYWIRSHTCLIKGRSLKHGKLCHNFKDFVFLAPAQS